MYDKAVNFENEDEELELKRAFERRARDFDDLNHEMAGQDVGRMSRFLPEGDGTGRGNSKKRSQQADDALTRLQLLMRDPVYAALYQGTMDIIVTAEAATERALEKALVRLREAEDALTDLQTRAAQLEDGTRIYRDEDGNFWSEDGSPVLLDEADSAEHWLPGMPGWEEFLEKRDAARSAAKDVDDIRDYQIGTLGAARDRMSDPDNPPGAEELDRIRRDVEDQMPEQVRHELGGPAETTIEPAGTSSLAVPKL